MNTVPFGFPDPTPTSSAPPPPRPASATAEGAQYGVYVLAGGVVVTIFGVALAAWQATRAKDKADDVGEKLEAYRLAHSARHAQLDAYLAARDARSDAEHAALWEAVRTKTLYQEPLALATAARLSAIAPAMDSLPSGPVRIFDPVAVTRTAQLAYAPPTTVLPSRPSRAVSDRLATLVLPSLGERPTLVWEGPATLRSVA